MSDSDALSAIIRAIDRIAAGDPSVRLGPDEAAALGALGASFNAMAAAVESRMKEDERKIGDSARRLMEYQQMAFLGSLVAGMAHEINTQIGIGVTAASNLESIYRELEKKYSGAAMTKSDLENAIAQSEENARVLSINLQRSAEFVQTLKSVASDQATGEIRFFRVREYLETIFLSLRPQLKRTSHAIEIDCDETLEVETSPGLLSQIVTNLVMNSLVHGFSEGQSGTIRISAKIATGSLILCYSDNGKGIPPDSMPRLFEPFFTTKKGQGGTGLGLYLIRQELSRRGGAIACESRPGEGVLFTAMIPVKVK